MNIEDIELVERLVEYADRHFDGHLTIMKFTTNWRVGFGTPLKGYSEDGVGVEMAEGETFREAALKALGNPQLVCCITAMAGFSFDDDGVNPLPPRNVLHVEMSEAKLNLVTAASTAAPDPFDLAGLRLSASFLETAGVKKLITTVPVHKPGKQDFVRVHPEPAFRENVALIELKDDRESYVVHHDLTGVAERGDRYSTLFTAINRQGVVFLWPVTFRRRSIRRERLARLAGMQPRWRWDKWLRAAGQHDARRV